MRTRTGEQRRVAGVVAWTLYALALCALVGTALLSGSIEGLVPRDTSTASDIIWSASWLSFGLVGALIVARRPSNRIGWMLCGITSGVYFMLFVTTYAIYGTLAVNDAPLATPALWVAKWLFVPVLGLVVTLVMLFPTGEVRGRGRRFLFRTAVGLFALQTVLIALEPRPIDDHPALMNPLGVGSGTPFMETVPTLLGFGIAAVFLAVVLDAVIRYRRARGVERKQFRWFVLALGLFPVLFVAALVLQGAGLGAERWGIDTVAFAFVISLNGLAAAIGVAVTRYRLFDIDRAVSRTVAYAILTAVLVGVYVGGVLGIGAVLRGLGVQGGDLVVAVSTLAVAALFQPVRHRVQAQVDRRFNRERYDGLRTVDAFGHRLRDELHIDALAGELGRTVRATVGPSSVALWIPERTWS